MPTTLSLEKRRVALRENSVAAVSDRAAGVRYLVQLHTIGVFGKETEAYEVRPVGNSDHAACLEHFITADPFGFADED